MPFNFSPEIGDNEKRMRKDMVNDAAEMLEAAGYKDIGTYDDFEDFGRCIHEMGMARMGHTPKESVLNKHNQVGEQKTFSQQNGACMVSNSCANPSLTYMALTARAADFAVNELKKGNL